MFHAGPLRFSEHQRPFWLLVAIAITLLVSVSVTVAQAASPARLVGNLQRDLGALRAELERLDPWPGDSGPQTVAFNADLGDGSPAFRRLSMVTIGRAAGRDLEALIASLRHGRDEEGARVAEALRPVMRELTEGVDRLSRPASPAITLALRGEVEAVLGDLERGLALLAAGRETAVAPPARVPTPAARP
jgi:hypothetical protein